MSEYTRKQSAMGHKAYQRLPKKLNIAGIFHTHLPEKDDTDGGVKANLSLTRRVPTDVHRGAAYKWSYLVPVTASECVHKLAPEWTAVLTICMSAESNV